MVAHQFPNFMFNNVTLKYVDEFKYLGHVMRNSQLDDADIHRERKNLFYRCNMLTSRAFQFGQKKVSIRFDSILATESIFLIRFDSAI